VDAAVCGCGRRRSLSRIDDCNGVLGLQPAEVHCWEPLLAFRWYGDSPATVCLALDLNARQHSPAAAQLGLDPAGVVSGCGARAGPRPRSRLADLQQGWQLPADLVEGLIWQGELRKGPLFGPSCPRRR